tara:strand:+ start:428 stop:1858 length:1431 start_codon:yes stop_codon:yes gene_type:complete
MASEIRVNQIQNRSGLSTVTFSDTGAIVSGIVTANNFSGNVTGAVTGSGANLTSIPAGQLTGTVADARLTTVSSSKLSGALPALDGSALTGINTAFGSGTSVNTSGIITATAFIPTNQNLSHRNKLINGAMQVNQRGFAGPITNVGGSSSTFTLDRWKFYIQSTSARFTVSKDSDRPDGFGAAMKIDCTTADTSLAALDEAYLEQRIEGQDLQEFAKGTSSAKQYTISFYAKTNKTGTYIVRLLGRDNTASCCSASYTVSNTNWNRYVITFPADTTNGRNDNNDNGEALRVVWWLLAGSGVNNGSLATTWRNSTDTGAATGQVNFADSTSNIFYLTGCQLEVGPVATPFEHLTYAEEFRRCARYCYQWIDDQQLGFGQVYSGSGYVKIFPPIPVNMRAKPSVTKNGSYWFVSYQGNSGYAGDRAVTVEGNSGDYPQQSSNTFRLFVNGGSNQGNGTTVWCLMHDTAGIYLRLEAEL